MWFGTQRSAHEERLLTSCNRFTSKYVISVNLRPPLLCFRPTLTLRPCINLKERKRVCKLIWCWRVRSIFL